MAAPAAPAEPSPSDRGEHSSLHVVPLDADRVQFVQLDEPAREAEVAGLWELMLPVSAFPDPYVVSDRSGQTAQRGLAALAGVPRDSRVTPAECAPAAVSDPVIVRTATAFDGASSFTLVLSRTDDPLTDLEGQLTDCTFAKAVDGRGTSSSVTDISVELLPPPMVSGDGALAYTRTVSRADSAASSRQLVLATQIGEHRVTAIAAQYEVGEPDATMLHLLFTNAIDRVAGR